MTRFPGAVATALFLISPCWAHNLEARYANAPGAPAVINGMMSGDADMAAELDIRNDSSKVITELQIGWVVESPPGCSVSGQPIESRVYYAPVEETSLAPGKTHRGLSYRVGTMHTWQLAKNLGSHHLLLQFGVVYVKFADGSIWKYDLKTIKTFDNHQQANEFACTAAASKLERQ
jgi:hypothetical protein